MPFNTGTYVTSYEDKEPCGSDADWEKRNCPIGCSSPNRWNYGCNGCRENYDAIDKQPPCQPYFDEIEKRSNEYFHNFNGISGWVPESSLSFEDGQKLLKSANVMMSQSVRYIAKPVVAYIIRLEHELELTQNERDKYKRLAYKKCCKHIIDNCECGGIRVDGKVCAVDGTFCQHVIDKVNKELEELK